MGKTLSLWITQKSPENSSKSKNIVRCHSWPKYEKGMISDDMFSSKSNKILESISEDVSFENNWLENHFKLGKYISLKTNSIVREGIRNDGYEEKYVIKMIKQSVLADKPFFTKLNLARFKIQDHQNFANILKIYKDNEYVYVITEFVEGVTLIQYINSMKRGKFIIVPVYC